MSPAIVFLLGLLGTALLFLILYFVVRAAVISAIRSAGANVANINQLLSIQADLTARLAKHLIAQSDLMVLTARNDGITDEQLAPVMAQIAERKAADSSFSLPFK